MRRAALAGVLLALLAAVPARASINQLSLFMDDNLLLYRGDAIEHRTMSELAGLGVDTVRVSVPWRAIASDRGPGRSRAAAFAAYDRLLRDAAQLQMGVLFNVTGGAPRWATGRLRGRNQGA